MLVLRLIAIACILVSLALLYPGISKPVLTLSGELDKAELADFGIDLIAGESADSQTRDMLNMMSRFMGLDQVEGRVEAYRNTRSILSMADELAASGNATVALLIITFSVVIPVLKILMQLLGLLLPRNQGRALMEFNAALGKWSMADVFVMAMLVSFMAGRASGHGGDLLILNAELEEGFWYFLAYCLFAIAAGTLLQLLWRRDGRQSGEGPQEVAFRETL